MLESSENTALKFAKDESLSAQSRAPLLVPEPNLCEGLGLAIISGEKSSKKFEKSFPKCLTNTLKSVIM